MKLKEIKNTFHQELDGIYALEEVDSFFYILIAHFYDIQRINLAIKPDHEVDDSETILNALDLLKKQKPIQYIIGETEFYGLPFKVNKSVLIPRPETEELVEWIIKQTDTNKEINILDIGTGSGCIAIALAKNLPNAKVYALDISAEALKVAKQNATLNNADVVFIEANILNVNLAELVSVSHRFDIIVSNPPYVREKEKALMKSNVLDNEPHLALFVKDENPLLFYEAITQLAFENLVNEGLVFFEINEYLGRNMIHLLNNNGFENIELKQDIFKKDRMIKGEKIND